MTLSNEAKTEVAAAMKQAIEEILFQSDFFEKTMEEIIKPSSCFMLFLDGEAYFNIGIGDTYVVEIKDKDIEIVAEMDGNIEDQIKGIDDFIERLKLARQQLESKR